MKCKHRTYDDVLKGKECTVCKYVEERMFLRSFTGDLSNMNQSYIILTLPEPGTANSSPYISFSKNTGYENITAQSVYLDSLKSRSFRDHVNDK